MDQEINPPLPSDVSVNTSSKNKKPIKFILIGVLILIVLFFGLHALLKRFSENSNTISSLLVHPLDSSKIISGTRSISGVSENTDELLNILGFKDKHIRGDNQENKGIIKTEDNRFWFFTVGNNGCVEFCNFPGYMIDTQKNTVSNLNVRDAMYDIQPIGGSIVTINEELSYNDGVEIYKTLIYDASKNQVVDEINPSNDTGNYTFVSDNFFMYTKSGILYTRDIAKHTSIIVGRLYQSLVDGFIPEEEGIYTLHNPLLFNKNRDVVYFLSYINKDSVNVPDIVPTKDDPLNLIAWNFKDNTSKIITDQIFNFPFYFGLLSEDTLFIGGGRDNNGLITYPSYIVNINTGNTKLIYSGPTTRITIDEVKKTINITGSDQVDTYWGLGEGNYDSITVFDFLGNLVSKTDAVHGNITYSTIKEGFGIGAQVGDIVSIDYSGYRANGDVFVTTYPTTQNLIHSETPEVEVGQHKSTSSEFGHVEYATALRYGLVGMKIGEKRHIVSPPSKNSDFDGNRGLFDLVLNNETVTFDVVLNAINGKSTPTKEIPIKNNNPITIYPYR